MKAIEYPGGETVQIILNPFRQRPADLFFEEAKRWDVGVIVRVPLVGLPYERGLDAVDALREHVPEESMMAQTALRWILDFEAVSTVIPSSTSPEHVRQNAAVSEAEPSLVRPTARSETSTRSPSSTTSTIAGSRPAVGVPDTISVE